jgi:7-cyano-7-deazaguanine tRNA-ribosyltransferase
MHRLNEWYQPSSDVVVVLPDTETPYHIHHAQAIKSIYEKNPDVDILVNSRIGPVPISLDEMYPFSQSVFPYRLDQQSRQIAKRFLKGFLDGKTVIYWEDKGSIQKIPSPNRKKDQPNEDVQRIFAVASMQFGRHSQKILFPGKLYFVKSKKTKKVRNVYSNDTHVVSLRASDGLFTLKIEGGRRLHDHVDPPRYRVVIDDDAVQFVKDGKSVFAKFVVHMDPLLRPFDECVVVDKNDRFLGVGRCLLNKCEMNDFSFGQAVKMREHIS